MRHRDAKTSANAVRRRPNRPATRNNHRCLRKTACTGGFYGRLLLRVVWPCGAPAAIYPVRGTAPLVRHSANAPAFARNKTGTRRPAGCAPGHRPRPATAAAPVRRVNLRRQMQRGIPSRSLKVVSAPAANNSRSCSSRPASTAAASGVAPVTALRTFTCAPLASSNRRYCASCSIAAVCSALLPSSPPPPSRRRDPATPARYPAAAKALPTATA